MDYYFSKFNEKFPNEEVNDYVILFKTQSFLEKNFKGKEQLIPFYNHNNAVGYIEISWLGIMGEPKLGLKINVLKTSKKNEVIINDGGKCKGRYDIIGGFKEKNKGVILNKITGRK